MWALVGEEARVAAAKDTAAAPVIDITKHGELRNWLPVAAAGSLPQAQPNCLRLRRRAQHQLGWSGPHERS